MADSVFVSTLEEYRSIIAFFHVLGVLVGVGGATLTDILFFKYLKDFRISEVEANTLNTISRFIWTAIGLLVLSGLGLYLPEMEELNQSSKFLTKVVVVSVMILNGLVLRFIVVPKLSAVSFLDGSAAFRRRIFAFGAVSGASWYSALLLGLLDKSPFSFPMLLSIYACLLIGAVISSQIVERILANRAKKTMP